MHQKCLGTFLENIARSSFSRTLPQLLYCIAVLIEAFNSLTQWQSKMKAGIQKQKIKIKSVSPKKKKFFKKCKAI